MHCLESHEIRRSHLWCEQEKDLSTEEFHKLEMKNPQGIQNLPCF